jgi:histone-lysine N-methyltransferase SETMAR
VQFTENIQANWQEGYCFIMTVPDPIQSEQPRREFKNYQWELLEHPPYSVDLAHSDFHLFGLLKSHPGGRHFSDDDEVEMEVWKWQRQQSKDLYTAGFDGLVKRWDRCW